MKAENVDIFVVFTDDYHMSEYSGAYFADREYLSGFTGSAGTLAVTQTEAHFLRTARYFVQAQAQLENDGLVVSLEFDYSDSVWFRHGYQYVARAGSQVVKGDTITITASKGKETKTTIVPNLLGHNIDDAIQMIKDAGLTYNASPVITATAIVRTRL